MLKRKFYDCLVEWTPPEPGFYVMKIRSVNERGEHSPEAARVEIEVE